MDVRGYFVGEGEMLRFGLLVPGWEMTLKHQIYNRLRMTVNICHCTTMRFECRSILKWGKIYMQLNSRIEMKQLKQFITISIRAIDL